MKLCCPKCNHISLYTTTIPGADTRYRLTYHAANILTFVSLYVFILTVHYAAFISLVMGWYLYLNASNLKTFNIHCDLCGWQERR